MRLFTLDSPLAAVVHGCADTLQHALTAGRHAELVFAPPMPRCDHALKQRLLCWEGGGLHQTSGLERGIETVSEASSEEHMTWQEWQKQYLVSRSGT